MKRWFYIVHLRLRSLFNRRRLEQDLDDEFQYHLERQTREYEAQGLPPTDARYAALRDMNGVEQQKEECRDARRVNLIDHLVQDLSYGLRMLRRSPGFTTAALLSLALGIGANTAIFTVIDALMVRQLPVKNPGRLVSLDLIEDGENQNFSYKMFENLSESLPVSTFSGVAAVRQYWRSAIIVNGTAGGLDGGDVLVGLVSGSYFSTLGVDPLFGSALTLDDDKMPGSNPVAVLSYDCWNRLGLGQDAVGRTLTLNGTPYTIVGVMPAGFTGDWVGRSTDIWVPIGMQPLVDPEHWDAMTNPRVTWVRIIARMQAGTSIEQARASAQLVWQQMLQDPIARQRYAGQQFGISSYSRGYSPERQNFKSMLILLMAVAGLILLITCANIACLLLARSAARSKEMSTRVALGAGPRRIIRQLLTESLLLSLIGGALGLAIASWGTRGLVKVLSTIPQTVNVGPLAVQLDVHPDVRILAFALVAASLTGLLFGLAPAIRASRISLASSLGGRTANSSASGRRFGLGKTLVVSQIAISLLLLVGAGLFIRTLSNLLTLNLGFDRDHLLLAWTYPGQTGRKGPDLASFYQMTQARLSALPGVISASTSMKGLLRTHGPTTRVRVPGIEVDDSDSPRMDLITPGFFATAGIPLLLGRDFDQSDNETAPHVAILNQYTANLYFPGQNPIGKTFGTAMMGRDNGYSQTEVVGVVGDARGTLSLRDPDRRIIYYPYRQDLGLNVHPRLVNMCVVVRAAGDPARLKPSIRDELRRMDPNLPVASLESVEEQLSQHLAQERLVAMLSACFGCLALLLSCIGLYGVISYATGRRVNEIGIRMALGASRFDVLAMVLGESMLLVTVGIAIGLLLALGCTHLISNMLYGVRPIDPSTIALATALMAGVAALAGFIPARRASNMEPTAALRYE